MKEAKFIELLNLYVDQEISPDEAALLEAEIAHNSERRKVYLQYCRMHRASTLLFQSFSSGEVPSAGRLAEAARSAEEKVMAFPKEKKSSLSYWMAGAGALAAAACLAFVFVHRNQAEAQKQSNLGTIVVKQPADVASKSQPVLVAAAKAQNLADEANYRPVFVSRPLGNHDKEAQGQIIAASTKADLDWMKKVQLEPMRDPSASELIFSEKPVQVQDLRVFTSQRSTPNRVEMGAFQFEK